MGVYCKPVLFSQFKGVQNIALQQISIVPDRLNRTIDK